MDDFRKEVTKVCGKKKFKVTNSWLVQDGHRYIRRNKWFDVGPVSEHDYYAIIRKVNEALIRRFYDTCAIKFPHRMGGLTLKKIQPKLEFKEGKLINHLPVNWDATLTLWSQDKEAYKDRTLIRHESREIYRAVYTKGTAAYNNKVFYRFTLHRSVKLKLKERIMNGEQNAFDKY